MGRFSIKFFFPILFNHLKYSDYFYLKIFLILFPESLHESSEPEACPHWTRNRTLQLISLFQNYRDQVGSVKVRNMRKLWERIASELGDFNVSPSQCENRWRVLERNYKKYTDNTNKTGRMRRFFEFYEEMDAIYNKRKSIPPEMIVTTETIYIPSIKEEVVVDDARDMDMDNSNIGEPSIEESSIMHEKTELRNPLKRNRTIETNRNRILENMRNDKKTYYQQMVRIQQNRLDVEKEKLIEVKRRNQLLHERNSILKQIALNN